MKRPILVAVIGYIIGIIIGLYFKFSIVLFYLPVILVAVFLKNIIIRKKKFSFYSISRYLRYFKLILNRKVITIIILFSCLSNFIVKEKNNQFENFYKTSSAVEIIAKVASNAEEKDYNNVYKIQVLEINKFNTNVCLYLKTDKKKNIKYGDIIKTKGKYAAPSKQRNYGGFDYSNYLKTIGVYGTVTAERLEVLEQAKTNDFGVLINNIKENVKSNAKKYLDEDTYSIYLGLVLGDTTFIDEETENAFRNSNMGHILAVSGMHITYIVIGIVLFFSKVSGKKIAKIISVIMLLLYIVLTGFSPSIIRACSMAIIMIVGEIIHRKADMWTSMAISLFIILIYNPFLITNIGLQYSYMGTLGIIILNKNISKIITPKKSKKESRVRQIIAISISAQIFILPITLFHFNTFGIYFLITNLLLSIIIGPIIILGFIFLILLLLDFPIIGLFAIPLKIGIQAILLITNISYLPLAKIYVRTPNIGEIVLFYLIVIVLNFVYSNINNKTPTTSNLRVRYMIQLIKYNFRKYKNKVIAGMLIITLLPLGFFIFNKNDLKIHFVDVGQGDCCFIETPENKTILIDGGGSEFGTFDVGKSTLLPYILDRGYIQIDYIISSHMDQDHIGGLLTIMEELSVKNVVISKQGENSDNYEKFVKIVKNKNIKVLVLGKGDRLNIENDLYFDFLWPQSGNLVKENVLNNNSIVCKMKYKDFSCLFTGDIEENAENKILQEYRNNLEILNSTVLKVAHHGSKTSSTQEFLEAVKPKISLIGVGENNKFGHPNEEVLQRLEKCSTKIYRTDEKGEITLEINGKGNIKIKTN